MVATIFEGAQAVLESIWERNNRLWPEWLWEVSPATIEIVRKNSKNDNRKDRPIAAAGRKRIVVWTSRPLLAAEKEMIPTFFEGWRVIIEPGSKLAYEQFLKRVEAEAELAEN